MSRINARWLLSLAACATLVMFTAAAREPEPPAAPRAPLTGYQRVTFSASAARGNWSQTFACPAGKKLLSGATDLYGRAQEVFTFRQQPVSDTEFRVWGGNAEYAPIAYSVVLICAVVD